MSDLTPEELDADIECLLDILSHPIVAITIAMNAHAIAADLSDETIMRFTALSIRYIALREED